MYLDGTDCSEKKVAIMQPYLFPYLGYFQLIHAADIFVFYDDVQYSKGGWINRNRILTNGSPGFFTLPVLKHGLNRKINEIICRIDNKWKSKLLKTIDQNYKKLNSHQEILHLVETCLPVGEHFISEIAKNSIISSCSFLGINKEFLCSSELSPNYSEKSREERLKAITKSFKSSTYLNLPGGRDLYCKTNFFNSGLGLIFIKNNCNLTRPNLSIIDIMMRFDRDFINQLVSSYNQE